MRVGTQQEESSKYYYLQMKAFGEEDVCWTRKSCFWNC